MVYRYLIHGLNLQLPFACDALLGECNDAAPDVCVLEGEVPRALNVPIVTEKIFDANLDSFLFRGGNRSARFLAERGQTIIFEKNRACEEGLFLHHLLYPVMAALLRQRQLLVLHASSAALHDGAVLIAGDSGAGKSTTLASLVARGHAMLTDDVTALSLDSDDRLEVLPGAMHVHLHEDAATHLSWDTKGIVRHAWHRMKIAVPVGVAAKRVRLPLKKIVFLSAEPAQKLQINPVAGRDKLPLLMRAFYGPLFVEQIQARFDLFSKALNDIDMTLVARPRGAWTLDAVIGAITDG